MKLSDLINSVLEKFVHFFTSFMEKIVQIFTDEDGCGLYISSTLFIFLVSLVVGLTKLIFGFIPAKKYEPEDSITTESETHSNECLESEVVVDMEEREYTKKLPNYNRK